MRRCIKLGLFLLLASRGLAWAGEQSQRLVGRGISLFDHGQYQQALGFFLQALELNPKDEKALYYQARAAQALSQERGSQLRKEGLMLARESLDQAERVKLAGILCGRGQKAFKAGDLVSAGRLFKESRSAFSRHSCAAIGLMMTRQALEKKRIMTEASMEELRLLADFSLAGEGAWSAATQVQPAAARALQAPPYETRPAAKPAPRSPAARANAEEPAQAGALETRRPTAPKSSGRLVSSAQDITASEELYLLAVADYMSGDWEKALESLRQALKLNPDNARARTLLNRMRMEGE